MRHLPRFLEICNCFCFVCIVVGEEDCMIFFFTFFSFCHQFSFCNGILISSLTHIRQQSMCTLLLFWEYVCFLFVCHFFFVWHTLPCVSPPFMVKHQVIRQSRRNNYLRWMSSERTNIAKFFVCFLQISILFSNFCGGGNAINPHTWILSHLLLNTWVWLPLQFVWNLPRIFLSKECVYTLPLGFTMLSNHTYLKMRVSSECLLHVCDPEIVVQNSVLSLDFFLYFNGLLSRVQSMMDCCCCCRCRRCCFPGGRDFYRFVEATVSRCVLEGLTFVSTLFESCEPYSWTPRNAWKIRSTYYRSSLPSCAIFEPQFTIHELSKFIWK